jgi:hypothetical protein
VTVPTIAFARKRHMPRATGLAVYLDTIEGPYLGDVAPFHETASGALNVKRPADRPSRQRGWRAHPAGEAAPLPLVFVSRDSAAAALADRRR